MPESSYLDEPKRLFKKYWIYGVGLIILAVAIYGVADYFSGDPLDNLVDEHREKEEQFIEKRDEAIKAYQEWKNAGSKQTGKVEVLRENYEKAVEEQNQAKKEVDEALEKVKIVEHNYEKGVAVNKAIENMCKAFPESKECQ